MDPNPFEPFGSRKGAGRRICRHGQIQAVCKFSAECRKEAFNRMLASRGQRQQRRDANAGTNNLTNAAIINSTKPRQRP